MVAILQNVRLTNIRSMLGAIKSLCNGYLSGTPLRSPGKLLQSSGCLHIEHPFDK